jgi:prefoldin subunit 2
LPISFRLITAALCRTVIDTLKTVDENRKCFRLIGGVLAEQTVKETLPNLIQNKEQLEKLIENGKEQLTKKGVEINQFKQEHNIKVRDEASEQKSEEAPAATAGKSNVLVS